MITVPLFRGSHLFSANADSDRGPIWYEKFSDARLARHLTDDPGGVKVTANYYRILNQTSHDLRSMLIE